MGGDELGPFKRLISYVWGGKLRIGPKERRIPKAPAGEKKKKKGVVRFVGEGRGWGWGSLIRALLWVVRLALTRRIVGRPYFCSHRWDGRLLEGSLDFGSGVTTGMAKVSRPAAGCHDALRDLEGESFRWRGDGSHEIRAHRSPTHRIQLTESPTPGNPLPLPPTPSLTTAWSPTRWRSTWRHWWVGSASPTARLREQARKSAAASPSTLTATDRKYRACSRIAARGAWRDRGSLRRLSVRPPLARGAPRIPAELRHRLQELGILS